MSVPARTRTPWSGAVETIREPATALALAWIAAVAGKMWWEILRP